MIVMCDLRSGFAWERSGNNRHREHIFSARAAPSALGAWAPSPCPSLFIQAFVPQTLKRSGFGQALFHLSGNQTRFLFSMSYLESMDTAWRKINKVLSPYQTRLLRPTLTTLLHSRKRWLLPPMGFQSTSSYLSVCLHRWALEVFKSSINIWWLDLSPHPSIYSSIQPSIHPNFYPSIHPFFHPSI